MVPIRYRLLGDSGLRVSELALGTMIFAHGGSSEVDRRTASRIFAAYRSAGGNLLDTDAILGAGGTESFLGELISDDRDAVVLGTKYTLSRPTGDPNSSGNHRKRLVQAVEASLRRLRTDRIDLLWINGWDFMTPEHEVMRALDDLVSAGKALYLGIANAPAWIVSRCNMLAQWRGWSAFVGLQVQYSLADRGADRELLPMARALNIGVLGCSPLNGGQLARPHGGRSHYRDGAVLVAYRHGPRSVQAMDVVATVARESGHTPAQVALAWVRDRGLIPVIGARTVEQMNENLGSLELSLSTEQAARLDRVSAVELGYPHDFLAATRPATFGGMYERIDRHRDRGAGTTR